MKMVRHFLQQPGRRSARATPGGRCPGRDTGGRRPRRRSTPSSCRSGTGRWRLLRKGVEAYTPPPLHAPAAMTMLLRCSGGALATALAGAPANKDIALAALSGERVRHGVARRRRRTEPPGVGAPPEEGAAGAGAPPRRAEGARADAARGGRGHRCRGRRGGVRGR